MFLFPLENISILALLNAKCYVMCAVGKKDRVCTVKMAALINVHSLLTNKAGSTLVSHDVKVL